MLNFTPIVRQHFISRLYEQTRYIDYADSIQQAQLVKLIEKAALTEIGRKYEFSKIRTYRQYSDIMPLHKYEDLRPRIMRMINGEAGVLWPGKTYNFAQSSGTSDGKSKYIPITPESFKLNHYQGSSDVVSHYFNLNPSSRLFSGKGFILGGSFANELDLRRGVRVGDLSANLIENINPLVNIFRIPDKQVALMPDWGEKLPALVDASIDENITSISGVPSWFLTVLKEVMKRKNVSCIHDVWPNLEVFFHGGIDFEPYRKQYEKICDMSKMHFINTYNASEGFFATQSDWSTTAMLLLLDVGIFFEFIPVEDIDSENPNIYPVWEVEQGHTYELVITACNGLWRYRIGDTVYIEQTKPVKIRVAGRTKSFINAFGEELMVHNAEQAIAEASSEHGAEVVDYTVAPVFADDSQHGHHQWLIEFAKSPDDYKGFMASLDRHLKAVNSDYEAKRAGDIFLDPPVLVVAAEGLFNRWLRENGKLGGQRKIPRLSNNRKIMDDLLILNDSIFKTK
jgi:phenylacetate-coenzyme A ligase PaaK-like adenylate-forming protein